MRSFRDLPIRSKLTLVIMATCSVAMVLGTIVLALRYTAAEQDNLAAHVDILAKVTATNSTSALAFKDPSGAVQTLAALEADPVVLGADIHDARGQLFARFRSPRGGAEVHPAGRSGAAPPAVTSGAQRQHFAFLADSLHAAHPIVLDGERIGTLVIEADLRPLRARLLLDAGAIGLVVLVAGLVALLLATRLQKLISEPISRLAATMRHVSEVNDYTQRVTGAGNDELGAMVSGFNRMLDQIQLRDEALGRSREQLLSAQRIARLGNWEWNAQQRGLCLSAEARRVLGMGDEPGMLTLDAFVERVYEADRAGVRRALEASLSDGALLDIEHRILADDGTVEFVHQRGQVCGDVRAGRSSFAGTVQNVSERARAQQELRITASALENTADSVVVVDADRRIAWINKAFGAMTGYARDEVVGRPLDLLRSGRHPAAFYDEMWRQVSVAGQWRGEAWSRRRNGEVYPQRLSISRIMDQSEHATHYVCVAIDISQYKRYEERLKFLAHHDTLTQLPNRGQFETRLPEAIARAQRDTTMGCVMFVDLDHFKSVNDSRGHADGDRLLRAAAARIRTCVRTIDVVARLGGDEFAVLLEGLTCTDDAREIAAKLVAALARPFDLGGPEIHISGSIGVGFFPQDGADAQTVLESADQAMYDIKARGRNGFRFFAERGAETALS